MKIVVISGNYPSPGNLYTNAFVHVRVKEYAKTNECLVITMDAPSDYIFENVNVRAIKYEVEANPIIREFNPDVIFIHFALKGIIKRILPANKQPVFIWVHGFEAQGWYRRLFNYSMREILSRSYLNRVSINIRQLFAFRQIIQKSNQYKNPKFIFVSHWMKKICEFDCAVTVNHFKIIPNPINTQLFYFLEKPIEHRTKVLMIRPFSSKKYATDIAIDAICKFSKKIEFSRFEFTIVGKGKLFEEQIRTIRDLANVKLVNSFLPQPEIKNLHDSHGVFLCPTRQDSQGVSMCEAMSSGLVVITSNNSAIPEFVEDEKTGYLTNSADEIVERLIFLEKNPHTFSKMSAAASLSISELSSMESTIQRELNFVESSFAVK